MSDSTGYAQVAQELPTWTAARVNAIADRLATRLTALRATQTMTERQLSEAARVLARMDDVIDTAINAGRREYE